MHCKMILKSSLFSASLLTLTVFRVNVIAEANDKTIKSKNEDMYYGEDINGALVFTDDPMKAPESANIRKKISKVTNNTVVENFPQPERKMVSDIRGRS